MDGKTALDRLAEFANREHNLELHSMLAKFNALHSGTSIVRVTEDGIQHISPEDFYMQADEEESRLATLSDTDLLKEWRECEPETPLCDLILGEIERRDLDL